MALNSLPALLGTLLTIADAPPAPTEVSTAEQLQEAISVGISEVEKRCMEVLKDPGSYKGYSRGGTGGMVDRNRTEKGPNSLDRCDIHTLAEGKRFDLEYREIREDEGANAMRLETSWGKQVLNYPGKVDYKCDESKGLEDDMPRIMEEVAKVMSLPESEVQRTIVDTIRLIKTRFIRMERSEKEVPGGREVTISDVNDVIDLTLERKAVPGKTPSCAILDRSGQRKGGSKKCDLPVIRQFSVDCNQVGSFFKRAENGHGRVHKNYNGRFK